MPPFVGRKRLSQSPLPSPAPPAKRAKLATKPPSRPASRPVTVRQKVSKFSFADEEDSSSSSLSEVDSDEFEDVPRKSKASKPSASKLQTDTDDEDEDEAEWEDAPAQTNLAPDFSNREFKDVKIAVQKDEEPDFGRARAGSKKGPSRREKAVRMNTHKMHVQMLLWHNSIRNTWINNKKLQEILLKQLPPQINQEIAKWKRASGLTVDAESPTATKHKKKKRRNKLSDVRSQRDWGEPSQRLDQGKADMSRGDPIITLLKVLVAYWRKRFAITAPGLRKRGYGTKLGLRQDIESFRTESHNPAKHGEKIETLPEFRKMAENSRGSRDAGAQLFTALLRGIGIEARMVASLQPAGYGFTKAEQMGPRKVVVPLSSDSSATDSEGDEPKAPVNRNKSKAAAPNTKTRPSRTAGAKSAPIDLDTDVEPGNEGADEVDDASVVDVTPSMPKARPPKFDQDLAFPIYWTEAVSPITSKVFPVCPLVLENAVATSAEALSFFEPRGAKAEKTKQIIAYVAAYSPDRTVKDVTVRYLRKKLWPGKTKGFRVPIEKLPVYDNRGNVKKHEEYDWFKHVLSIYTRPDDKRTAADDLEDATDLVPAEPEKKEVDIDTLQGLKSSSEFVLERHLRREEALLPGSESVRTFVSGKGDKQTSEPVYKRSDVVRVATAESWHKEGRAPKEGEIPIKLAPVRAVTLARKREAEEHQIRTGEKQMQGLYSQDQTDWIIPPPIKDGIIPKNSYGNIDCFVPSMVPRGAVHLPLKGTVRICKKLEIDYAEAVVGFEFGNKMAVPVIQGVVIAKENEKVLRDAWREWNEEQRKREESKMERLVLDLWRKFTLGLRIRARVQDEYTVELDGGDLQKGFSRDEPMVIDDEETETAALETRNEDEFGGGFLPESEDETTHGAELTFHEASQEEPRQLQDYEDEAMDVKYTGKLLTTLTAAGKRTQMTNGHTQNSTNLVHENQEEDYDTTGGGFFMNGDHESATPKSRTGIAFTKDSAPSSDIDDDSIDEHDDDNNDSEFFTGEATIASKPTPRRRTTKQPSQKSSRMETSSKTQRAGSRTTPARNAKGKAKITISKEANGDDSAAGEEEGAIPPSKDSTKSGKKKKIRGQDQTRKFNNSNNNAGRRELRREESTLISSPYFERH